MFRDKDGFLRPMVPQRRQSHGRDEERRVQLKRKQLEDKMEENARKNVGTDEERAAKEAYKRKCEEAAKKKARRRQRKKQGSKQRKMQNGMTCSQLCWGERGVCLDSPRAPRPN